MAKRFMTLFITASLLVGVSGLAQAGTWRDDFERRGTVDYPLRPLVYIIYPVGWALNVLIYRPATYVACILPDVTGCGPEDVRALGIEESSQLEEIYQEVPAK